MGGVCNIRNEGCRLSQVAKIRAERHPRRQRTATKLLSLMGRIRSEDALQLADLRSHDCQKQIGCCCVSSILVGKLRYDPGSCKNRSPLAEQTSIDSFLLLLSWAVLARETKSSGWWLDGSTPFGQGDLELAGIIPF